jgi:hypothetical protein
MAGFGAIDRTLEGLRVGALKSSAVLVEAESAFAQLGLGSIEFRLVAPGR